MTTIAYRAGILAADTASSGGGIVLPYAQRHKVRRTTDGRLVGAAGDGGWCDWFHRWAAEPDASARPAWRSAPEDEGVGIIVLRDGSVWVHALDDVGHLVENPYDAWGAGAKFAFGAMHAGAGAQDAVRAAIAHCPWTAGEVKFVTLDAGEVRELRAPALVIPDGR